MVAWRLFSSFSRGASSFSSLPLTPIPTQLSILFFLGKGAVSCSYCVAISAWCGHKGGHKGGMAKPASASVTTAEEPNFDTDFTMAQQLIDMTAEEHGGESVCRQGIAGVCALC